MTKLDKFVILGQPWLQVVNPDIYWSTTKTIRDRNTGEAMAFGDEYTVNVELQYYITWRRMRWQSCLGNNQRTSS
jgi:hypothetical protein